MSIFTLEVRYNSLIFCFCISYFLFSMDFNIIFLGKPFKLNLKAQVHFTLKNIKLLFSEVRYILNGCQSLVLTNISIIMLVFLMIYLNIKEYGDNWLLAVSIWFFKLTYNWFKIFKGISKYF